MPTRNAKSAPPAKPTGFDVFYAAVRKVPKGSVSTYGAIASVAGMPRAARQVGFALGALREPDTKIPWQRVLASKSRYHAVITPRGRGFAARQRALLESEGVVFDTRGRVDLREFGWPGARERQATKRSLQTPGTAGKKAPQKKIGNRSQRRRN